jgi:pre-mRNA-splicing factor 38A
MPSISLNSTDPNAVQIHGTNPQYLIEKITRTKIYNCTYWKESCFGLNASSIIDRAVALKYCGGVYGGNSKPSHFLCLLLKMLQLQPEMEIILEFIRNDDFKYLRALGATYLRLIGKAEDVYKYLEPLYNDYCKLAYRTVHGWSIKHMDEFIDDLLNQELVCDIALPFLTKRHKLEDLGALEPRKSVLDYELEEYEDSSNKKHVDIPLETSVKVDAIIEKDEVKLTTSYAASIQLNSHVVENDRDISISKRDDSRDRGRRDDSRDRRKRDDSRDRGRRDDSRDRGRRDDSRDRGRRGDSRDRGKRDDRDSRDDKKFSLDNRSRSRSRSPPHANTMNNEKDEKIKKKKEAKFDKIFKTKKAAVPGGGSSTNDSQVAPEGSVEYWNQIRKGLGMRELK